MDSALRTLREERPHWTLDYGAGKWCWVDPQNAASFPLDDEQAVRAHIQASPRLYGLNETQVKDTADSTLSQLFARINEGRGAASSKLSRGATTKAAIDLHRGLVDLSESFAFANLVSTKKCLTGPKRRHDEDDDYMMADARGVYDAGQSDDDDDDDDEDDDETYDAAQVRMDESVRFLKRMMKKGR